MLQDFTFTLYSVHAGQSEIFTGAARAALVFRRKMPTVRWEPRKSCQRYYYHSLERFKLYNLIKDIELFLAWMIFDASYDHNFDEMLLCVLAIFLDNLHNECPFSEGH